MKKKVGCEQLSSNSIFFFHFFSSSGDDDDDDDDEDLTIDKEILINLNEYLRRKKIQLSLHYHLILS